MGEGDASKAVADLAGGAELGATGEPNGGSDATRECCMHMAWKWGDRLEKRRRVFLARPLLGVRFGADDRL